ncbi:MAG: hypothetical protein H7835_18215, partial [Magnetococcus sp. XQGC-1]
ASHGIDNRRVVSQVSNATSCGAPPILDLAVLHAAHELRLVNELSSMGMRVAAEQIQNGRCPAARRIADLAYNATVIYPVRGAR